MMSRMTTSTFQAYLWDWYEKNKREFPWRSTRDPYRIWVSELMLQQTQTERVLPKYKTFLEEFSSVELLSKAKLTSVLRLWQGLGYNRRALYLHKAASEVVTRFNGMLPISVKQLQTLPGIGPYTSCAIATFAFNSPEIFIETNIRSVFLHHFFRGKSAVDDSEILQKVKETLAIENPRDWYYALMDYGAHIKKTQKNPNIRSKHYTKQSKFEGSDRQVRGYILRSLLQQKKLTKQTLVDEFDKSPQNIQAIIDKLCNEKLIQTNDQEQLFLVS